MLPKALKHPAKKSNKTAGGAFLTGMRNIIEYVESSSSEDENPAPAKLSGASIFKGILAAATKAGENMVTDPAKKVQNLKDTANIPAEQLAALQKILDSVHKNQRSAYERNFWEREHLHHIPNLDINGYRNLTNEPIYYCPNATSANKVAGVPYAVSDTIDTCNRCTLYSKCERHCKPAFQSTDVSLCKKSHLRMKVTWDVADPENRKGTWRFGIEEKFDRFNYPQEEREEHERAQAAKLNGQEEGCCPVRPKDKIKELVKRITEDHNDEANFQARKKHLDPKGGEYHTKPRHWGGKDPFTASGSSNTREAKQCMPMDGDNNRIEQELRALLQTWHKSQLKPEERMRDRTTASMKKTWAVKMEVEKAARHLKSVKETDTVENPTGDKWNAMYQVQSARTDRYKMSTWDPRAFEADRVAAAAAPEQNKAKVASKDLTAEERKILKRLNKAEEADAQAYAEVDAQLREPTPESKEQLFPEPVEAKSILSTKRKASQPVSNEQGSKKFKSANIIDNSDDEADYELSKAPEFELPEQREGWEFAEKLDSKIAETVPVLQSDDVTEVPETMVVVEQGTSIVKEIGVMPEVEEPLTPPLYRSPAPSPPSSPSKKRKNFFGDSSESGDGSASPAKKVKKVGFSPETVSPAGTPRRVSTVYDLTAKINGSEEEGEVREVDEHCDLFE